MVRELARGLFGENAAPHAVLARWDRDDVKGIQKDDPVLLSQCVPGQTLLEVVNPRVKDPNPKNNVLKKLDAAAFSQAVLLAILTMPEDGKPDNYICEELPSGRYRLVCIDNDHSFAPAASERGLHAHFKVKCILFCLDTMHDAIDPGVRSAVLNATGGLTKNTVFGVLRRWLTVLSRMASQHDALYDGSSRSASQLWKKNTVRFNVASSR